MKQVTTEYTPGQRVVNEAEPALGLGTVARVLDHRNVEIEFRAADTTRVYNVKTAPLRRLILAVGQEARGRNGERFKVDSVHRKAGLLVYRGNGSLLHEKDLADDAPSDGAVEKLLGGQLSPFSDFELRFDGWKIRQAALNPDTRGLVGARVRLLPHQLYIAHEVSRRELPRVLLADEVGLGKTIEAGLIFSVMRALGRAERVLVLVPESLVHQWLAEFYRRFNEMFTVLDEERCEQLEEKEFSAFQVARRMICNIDWLVKNPRRLKQAEQVRWDLVIVDEAHHLEWKGSAYQAIDRLSQRAKGLLLLTATPMRDGLSTEFGLLRLVDPERFHDFKAFQEEQAHLGKLARLARKIADGKEDLGPLLDQLATLYPHDEGLQHHVAQLRKKDDKAGRRELIGALVDRHGTGRVLIRNRRDRLKGFPRRVLHPVGFDMPRQWRFVYEQIDPEALDLEDFVAMGSSVHNVHPRMLATSEDRPQRLEPATFKAAREADPRVPWLVSFLREHPRDKVLLICSRPSTVIALQEQIKHHSTVRTGVFHEGLSVVERDRQAAYFADPSGAQVLLCSEIGGEGRNFQFSHHLVLYDLPLHPDTLEQRIGRLDRIGQDHPIDIHALFVRETPQEALFAWLDRGLHAFEKPVHGSEHVMHRLSEDLLGTLRAWLVRSTHHAQQDARLESLLGTSAEALDEVRKARQKSIDYLVDLNSFDEAEGRRVMRAIDGADTDRALQDYMERLLDRFGVHDEELDAQGRRHIKPGDLMFVEVFPGLTRDDGIGATYKRELALAREDLDFLSADHPLVEGGLSLLLEQGEGVASAALWSGAPRNGVLVQFLFVLEATGPARLELNRYLAVSPLIVATDLHGNPADDLEIPLDALSRVEPRFLASQHGALQHALPHAADAARRIAGERTRPLRERAVKEAQTVLQAEQERLEELVRVNPSMPAAEVDGHAARVRDTLGALKHADVRLDAVRLILMTTG